MSDRLIQEIDMMTYEAKQFLVTYYLENEDNQLTLLLLKNLGIDIERLVTLKCQKFRSTKSIVQSILDEVKFEHQDLTTSTNDEMEEHQDIQISKFSLSEMNGSPNKSVTIFRTALQTPTPVNEGMKS